MEKPVWWEQRSVFLWKRKKCLPLFAEKNIDIVEVLLSWMTSFLSNNFDRLIGIIFTLSPEIVFLDRTVWQRRTVWKRHQLTNIRCHKRDQAQWIGSCPPCERSIQAKIHRYLDCPYELSIDETWGQDWTEGRIESHVAGTEPAWRAQTPGAPRTPGAYRAALKMGGGEKRPRPMDWDNRPS